MSEMRTYLMKSLAAAAVVVGLSYSALAEVPTLDKPKTLSSWVAITAQAVRHAAVYPESARELAHEGSPEMRITVDRQGRVTKVALAETSGFTELDNAAKSLVHNLTFPALPEGFDGRDLTFNIAINYDLLSVND